MSGIFNKEYGFVPCLAGKQLWKVPKFSYMKSPRPDFGFMLLTDGKIDITYESGEISACPGEIVFLPKNSYYEVHFHIESGSVEDYLINFEADADSLNIKHPIKIASHISEECKEKFVSFVEENHNFDEVTFKRMGDFYLLFHLIMNSHREDSPREKMLVKAKELLKNDNDISIREIAKECAVSESGLRKIFVDDMGMSPNKYRIDIKIDKARYLLEATDMTVGEISDSLGFFDTAYFCKIFKTKVGVTPKKYSKLKKL